MHVPSNFFAWEFVGETHAIMFCVFYTYLFVWLFAHVRKKINHGSKFCGWLRLKERFMLHSLDPMDGMIMTEKD